MMDHPSSINRFDAFGDYDYVDTSHHVTHNTPNFESLKGVNNLIKVDLIGCLNTRKCKATFHYTGFSSEIGIKLRESAVEQAGALRSRVSEHLY